MNEIGIDVADRRIIGGRGRRNFGKAHPARDPVVLIVEMARVVDIHVKHNGVGPGLGIGIQNGLPQRAGAAVVRIGHRKGGIESKHRYRVEEVPIFELFNLQGDWTLRLVRRATVAGGTDCESAEPVAEQHRCAS